jgi:hypothetical protein
VRERGSISIQRIVIDSVFIAAMTCCASLCHGQSGPPFTITVDKEYKSQKDVTQKASQTIVNEAPRVPVYRHVPKIVENQQSLTLVFKIKNQKRTSVSGLKVRYAVFGKTIADRSSIGMAPDGRDVKPGRAKAADVLASDYTARRSETVVLKQDSTELSWESLQTQTFRVPVEFSSSVMRYETLGSIQAKEGETYYGCAIGIYDGGKLVASYIHPNSLASKKKDGGWKALDLDWP